MKTPDGDVGRTLINEGLAWHYDEDRPSPPVLSRLEERARSEERGLWSQDNPQAPWAWRRGPEKVHLAEFVGQGLRVALSAVFAGAGALVLTMGSVIPGVLCLSLAVLFLYVD